MVLVFEHTLHTSPCKSQSTDVVTWALAMSDLPIMAIINNKAHRIGQWWSFLMSQRWSFLNRQILEMRSKLVIHRDERSNFLERAPETTVVEIAWWFRSTTSRAYCYCW